MQKSRKTCIVILLSLVTFGIYWLYWYYSINKEIQEHVGEKVKFSPGMALLSQFVPIANFVSQYNTAKRIQTMKNICNDPDSLSPGAAVLFSIFLPFGIYTYMLQSAMNTHWHHHSYTEEKNTETS